MLQDACNKLKCLDCGHCQWLILPSYLPSKLGRKQLIAPPVLSYLCHKSLLPGGKAYRPPPRPPWNLSSMDQCASFPLRRENANITYITYIGK